MGYKVSGCALWTDKLRCPAEIVGTLAIKDIAYDAVLQISLLQNISLAT